MCIQRAGAIQAIGMDPDCEDMFTASTSDNRLALWYKFESRDNSGYLASNAKTQMNGFTSSTTAKQGTGSVNIQYSVATAAFEIRNPSSAGGGLIDDSRPTISFWMYVPDTSVNSFTSSSYSGSQRFRLMHFFISSGYSSPGEIIIELDKRGNVYSTRTPYGYGTTSNQLFNIFTETNVWKNYFIQNGGTVYIDLQYKNGLG